MSLTYRYQFENYDSPFWAFAIHDGHQVDAHLMPYINISDEDRLREEDPYTAILAELPCNRFVSGTSRFQLDLNRKREDAIYLTPEQAWGMRVWRTDLPNELKDQLYAAYDRIYEEISQAIQHTIDRYGYFIVYDIHSYNMRRGGADTSLNNETDPQINIGTQHNHKKWRTLTDQVLEALQTGKDGQVYDVRENVKFKGGFLSAYLNDKFGDKGCIFSIEFRKDFMDEWTGEVYPQKASRSINNFSCTALEHWKIILPMKDNAKQLAGILKMIKNKEVFHVQIPPKNKLVFNQVVPYLFLYRQFFSQDPMLAELVKSEPAYFRVRDPQMNVSEWIAPILNQLVEEFGACLIIEAWAADSAQEEDIQIHIARKNVQAIAQYLGKQLTTEESISKVEILTDSKTNATQSLSPSSVQLDNLNTNIFYMGLEIKPKYLLGVDQQILPIDLRHFREAISRSLSKTFFEFIRIHTLSKPTAFKISQPKKMLPLAWEIDQKLARESQRFDFLLLVTPTNSYDAWQQFKKGNYRKTPVFRYRPMPIDPDIIKRNLYNLHIEDLFDPSIAYLFRDKRKELDQMMTMLSERGKEGFLLGSMQVFGTVNEKLLEKAQAILTITTTDREVRTKEEDIVYAEEFAKLAQEELDYLKNQDPSFGTTVRLRDDIYGVMVNQGVLNISKQYSLPRNRVKALIQHEVGTHIVTYYNGKQQPFSLFRLGVPGYEKLQEGLAVLAEYLVGGLTNNRLRILAGRVIAVHHMQQGSSFIDTFSVLVDKYQFLTETAFQMTMRVYRSGGLTKDALYLSGLIELTNYIKSGRDLSLLTMGKIREDYIPIVEELMLKGVLKAPVLTPRYLMDPYKEALLHLKKSNGIFQMIQ